MGAKNNNGENGPMLPPAGAWPHAAPECATQPYHVASRSDPTVVDNLPADIPITARELEVLETYVADLIDQLLDHAPASGDGSPPK